MPLPPKNIRGLQDIRTHSGRVDESHLPPKAYLKIACLEMEKVRRGKERESAACRIENIDARFHEIAAEKAKLLRSLSEQESGMHTRGRVCHVSDNAAKPAPSRKEPGFKLRY